MKLQLSAPRPLRRNPGLAFGLLLLPFALLQVFLPSRLALHCGLLERTGWPCPTCGTTRCLQLVLHGNLAGAFRMQPLLFCAAGLFAGWLIYTSTALIFNRRVVQLRLESRKETFGMLGFLGLLLFINWTYLIFIH